MAMNTGARSSASMSEPIVIIEEDSFDVLVELVTVNGSHYWVGRDPQTGTWWMRGENVPNPISARLDPTRWWQIEQPDPWPVRLQERVMLRAASHLAMDDPLRIPGGGKFTSPIRDVCVMRVSPGIAVVRVP